MKLYTCAIHAENKKHWRMYTIAIVASNEQEAKDMLWNTLKKTSIN